MKISVINPIYTCLKPGKTITLSIFIFILAIGSCEAIFRSAWFQTQFPVPYPVGGYKSAEDAFRNLNSFLRDNGKVDCIILGSSLATVGINPIIFEEKFQSQSGQTIKCYNFGVSAGTASSFGPLAAILVRHYHPALIIVADRSRAFSEVSNEFEANFSETPWARFHRGEQNFQGWIEDISYIFRYLEINFPQIIFNNVQSSQWQDPNQNGKTNLVNARSVQGYSPLVTFLDGAAIYWIKEGIPYQKRTPSRPFKLSENDIKGLNQIIKLNKEESTRIIFVEMPSPDSFFINPDGAPRPTEQEVYRTTIAKTARKNGVPFWTTSEMDLVPAIDFADGKHLYIIGSMEFSAWLGYQVGEAVNRGLFSDHLSTDLIEKPPMDEIPTSQTCCENHGLSRETLAEYLVHLNTFNLIPKDSTIFNPHPVALDKEMAQNILGFFIQWSETVNDQNRSDLFDLMALQGKMVFPEDPQFNSIQKEAIGRWYTTGNPADLSSADIDYVLYTEQWDNINTRPGKEWDNPDYYRVLKRWEYPPLRETYILYQVIAE